MESTNFRSEILEKPVASLASPRLPGPCVEKAWLVVGLRGCSGLSRGWAPSLVCQALLNGHLDQLLLAQAAVQAEFLMPDGTLCAPGSDLGRHPGRLSSSLQKRLCSNKCTERDKSLWGSQNPPVTERSTRQPCSPTGRAVQL